jgi:hypothetical protein
MATSSHVCGLCNHTVDNNNAHFPRECEKCSGVMRHYWDEQDNCTDDSDDCVGEP